MKNVLGLALYGPLAASTRYRMAQYVSGLAQRGIRLEIRSLLGDDYLRRSFAGQRVSPWAMLHAGARRLADLLEQRRYDGLMLHCELFPLLPGPLESFLLRKPYLYDFDDAFYLKYRSERFRALQPVLGEKFNAVLGKARAVTAGNSTLAQYAEQHNSNVRLLPTVVDTNRYFVRPRPRGADFVVGWVGSPSTAPYLQELAAPLSRLGTEGPVRLVVVGGQAPQVDNVEVEQLAWSEADEVELIQRFDVGVMPLVDDDWARGKCAFKLIQYMACGIPVIASPVGANVPVVGNDAGLLASTSDEWLSALRALRDTPEMAAGMGLTGRRRIEDRYSLNTGLDVLTDALMATCE